MSIKIPSLKARNLVRILAFGNACVYTGNWQDSRWVSWFIAVLYTELISRLLDNRQRYSRITSIKYPSFCTTTFSLSLTNFTVLLPQSPDCSCYVSRSILAPTPLWLQEHTALLAHDFAHCPYLGNQPGLANVTCASNWGLCIINRDLDATISGLRQYKQQLNYYTPTNALLYCNSLISLH